MTNQEIEDQGIELASFFMDKLKEFPHSEIMDVRVIAIGTSRVIGSFIGSMGHDKKMRFAEYYLEGVIEFMGVPFKVVRTDQ